MGLRRKWYILGILSILMFINLVNVAYSLDLTGLKVAYHFSGDYTDYFGRFNATNYLTYSSSGYEGGLNKSVSTHDYTGHPYVNLTTGLTNTGQNGTFSYWFNITHTNTIDGSDTLFCNSKGASAAQSGWCLYRINGAGAGQYELTIRKGYGAGNEGLFTGAATKIANNRTYHVLITYNTVGNNITIYINGTVVNTSTFANGVANPDTEMYLFSKNDNGVFTAAYEMWGSGDEFLYFENRTFTGSEALELYQLYDRWDITTSNFTITAYKNITEERIYNFSAIVNGTLYYSNVVTGELITGLQKNTSKLINITVYSYPYRDKVYNDYNVSNDLTAYLLSNFSLVNHGYTNFIRINNNNYTKELYYNISIICETGNNATITTYINQTQKKVDVLVCNDNLNNYNTEITNITEGKFNITLFLNTTVNYPDNNYYFANATFIWDLTQPTINLSYANKLLINNNSVNVSLLCVDNLATNLSYVLQYNNATIYLGNNSNNTQQTNQTNRTIDGTNILFGICSDFINSVNDTLEITGYRKTIYLIDEKNNVLFNVANLTNVIVYLDNNSTSYNFKAASANQINITSLDETKLRFEFGYYSGDTVTRYIDISLLPSPIRVCINKDDVKHFQQRIVSGSISTVAFLKNVYSNCYIAADYTRFAYSGSYILNAYSISSQYYLYTYSNGVQTYLASLDGSQEANINIDEITFNQRGYDTGITREAIAVNVYNSHTVKLYYKNIANNTISGTLTITDLTNNSIVLSISEFSNYNEWLVYFDYGSFNITNATVFKAVYLREDSGNRLREITAYFNTGVPTDKLNTGLAMFIAWMLFIVGLTMASTKTTFGWFGIFINVASIVILALAEQTWYTGLSLAVMVVALVYFVMVLLQSDNTSISG